MPLVSCYRHRKVIGKQDILYEHYTFLEHLCGNWTSPKLDRCGLRHLSPVSKAIEMRHYARGDTEVERDNDTVDSVHTVQYMDQHSLRRGVLA